MRILKAVLKVSKQFLDFARTLITDRGGSEFFPHFPHFHSILNEKVGKIFRIQLLTFKIGQLSISIFKNNDEVRAISTHLLDIAGKDYGSIIQYLIKASNKIFANANPHSEIIHQILSLCYSKQTRYSYLINFFKPKYTFKKFFPRQLIFDEISDI